MTLKNESINPNLVLTLVYFMDCEYFSSSKTFLNYSGTVGTSDLMFKYSEISSNRKIKTTAAIIIQNM